MESARKEGAIRMYRTKEQINKGLEIKEESLCQEGERLFSVDALLNLTETIATMAMAAGFLLLVAAWLASL